MWAGKSGVPPMAAQELTAVSADGARIHVEVHGRKDAPSVVLVHGWTCQAAFWARVTRALAVDHRVVLYDQRGHGRSPATRRFRYTTHALADDLEAVLREALSPGERAVITGHSMGGMAVMAAAGRQVLPEHAAAVVLCSTGGSRLLAESRVVPLHSERLRSRVHRTLLGSRAPLGPVTPLSRRILQYAAMGPRATPETVLECARIVHACPPRVRAGWGRVLAGMDLEAHLPRLTMPTAVIVGAADRLTPAVHARRIAAGLPQCAGLTELAGVGHMTPLEAPEPVIGIIRLLVRDYMTTPAREAGLRHG